MTSGLLGVHAGLRAWAKGSYPLEAGVELLIRTSAGRFASSAQPWVRRGDDPGWWWIDVDRLTEEHFGALSGGEVRLLRIAASLLGAQPVNLSQEIPGLDRDNLQLVLAGIAHACGSHEHSGPPTPDPHGRYVTADGTRMSIPRLGSLYPWPSAT